MIQGVDHEIHRYNVQPATFNTDGGYPLGQRMTDLLNHLEEVIGPVHLVHFAGFRMANDHTRAVDAERNLAFFTHNFFGFVLGAQVRMIKLLGFFEHILPEDTLEQTRCRDG